MMMMMMMMMMISESSRQTYFHIPFAIKYHSIATGIPPPLARITLCMRPAPAAAASAALLCNSRVLRQLDQVPRTHCRTHTRTRCRQGAGTASKK